MSTSEHICDKLSVVEGIKKGILGGPFQTEFTLNNGVSVSINQAGKRFIEFSASAPLSCDELFVCFQTVEKLLMLFDGRFYALEQLVFSTNGTEQPDITSEYLQKRLGYFSSRDIYRDPCLCLMPFQDVLNAELIEKWNSLLEELGIAHQVFLYSMSDNKMTVDLNFAFLVELAEPFAELLKEKTYFCQSLVPGERGTTLKMCVDTLIMIFGKDIFADELSRDYASFLDKVVGSRVRVMHIKKKITNYLDVGMLLQTSMKFNLLYRVILFELLGISQIEYKSALLSAVKAVDDWQIQ